MVLKFYCIHIWHKIFLGWDANAKWNGSEVSFSCSFSFYYILLQLLNCVKFGLLLNSIVAWEGIEDRWMYVCAVCSVIEWESWVVFFSSARPVAKPTWTASSLPAPHRSSVSLIGPHPTFTRVSLSPRTWTPLSCLINSRPVSHFLDTK